MIRTPAEALVEEVLRYQLPPGEDIVNSAAAYKLIDGDGSCIDAVKTAIRNGRGYRERLGFSHLCLALLVLCCRHKDDGLVSFIRSLPVPVIAEIVRLTTSLIPAGPKSPSRNRATFTRDLYNYIRSLESESDPQLREAARRVVRRCRRFGFNPDSIRED